MDAEKTVFRLKYLTKMFLSVGGRKTKVGKVLGLGELKSTCDSVSPLNLLEVLSVTLQMFRGMQVL